MTRNFDVAVLGSGMSGSILASLLGKRGISVALLDEKTHPRFAVGESTIPHTSLLLSILAQQHGVPELDLLAYPDRLAKHVTTSCGIKRAFGFAYHRPGLAHDPREGLQFGTSSKDESHLFRQDVDAWLVEVAAGYGAELHLGVPPVSWRIDESGVELQVDPGRKLRARYLVDATGYRSPVARHYGLREEPTRLRHHSRSLFTHMTGVRPFQAVDSPFSLSWDQSTLHHVFEGGWFWVIPFNNAPWSTNPVTSVGLTLDPRVHPSGPEAPEEEFRRFLGRFPDVARQFVDVTRVRPWVSTGRLQYSSSQCAGRRYCLMSHSDGFVDPLFSRGLINSIEVIAALIDPLTASLQDGDPDPDRFEKVVRLQRRSLDYNDLLVRNAFLSWRDFDLWNAWSRVWALGTIITEFRLMNVLTDFTDSGDRRLLNGEAADPACSRHEDPDYAAFFRDACREMEYFEASRVNAAEVARRIFRLTRKYDMQVPIRRDAMRRAGWLRDGDELSDRNVSFARSGYRWAIANRDTRDLYGNSETFYRWRARQADPHL